MAQQPKTCPKCRRISPPFALRCDCGYNFDTGVMERPEVWPDQSPVASDGGSKAAGIGCLVFAVLLLVVCVGNLVREAPDTGTAEGAGFMCGTFLWPALAFFVAYKLLRRKQ